MLLRYLLLFALYCATPLPAPCSAEPGAVPPPVWETEFEQICAKTPEVMSLSREELQRLVSECDRLQPQIEALPETPRKVYRKRLEMTRKLLLFALEAKSQTEPPDR